MLLNEFERVVDSHSLRIGEVIQAGPPWNSRVTHLEFQLLLYHQYLVALLQPKRWLGNGLSRARTMT
jgi:hypothetical protein